MSSSRGEANCPSAEGRRAIESFGDRQALRGRASDLRLTRRLTVERKHQTRRPQTNGRCRLIVAAPSLLLKDTTAAWAASSDACSRACAPSPIDFFDAIPNSPDVCMPLHMRLPQEMFCVLHCAGMRCVRTLEARGIL